MKKYPYAICWKHSDGSSTLGGAKDFDAAIKAATELRPKSATEAVIRFGRKVLRKIKFSDFKYNEKEMFPFATSRNQMTD